MKIYTVYKNPADYPDKIVVRGWVIDGSPAPKAEPNPLYVGPINARAHAEARRAIRAAGHFFCMPRQEGDDPVILEVWL